MKIVLSLVILLIFSTAQASGIGSVLSLVEVFASKSTRQTLPAKVRHINLRSATDNNTHLGLEFRTFNAPRTSAGVEIRTGKQFHSELVAETKRLVKEIEPKVIKLELFVLEMDNATPVQVEKLLSEISPAFALSHELIKGVANQNRNADTLLRHKANADRIYDVFTKGLDHQQAGMTERSFEKTRNILLSYAMDAQRL